MNLSTQFQKIRQESIDICKPLNAEDYMLQPVYFTSPAKWSLGHTSWFFEEMILKAYLSGYEVYHPRFNYLFNSYYNALGERLVRNNRADFSRPTVEEIHAYRKHVDQKILELIDEQTPGKELTALITLGLNHEQQHQELLLTDLKYAFSVNPLYPAYSNKALCEDQEPDNPQFLDVKGGIYDIGFAGTGFCYDNELEQHQVMCQPFSIRNTLVTNGEYQEFIEDNGYSRFEFWHDEALSWLSENRIQHPMYWKDMDGEWFQFTLAGLHRINHDHILTHITYYEASAFARWKGYRLPTEFEWEAAADKLKWGKRWEYTESAYLPYPGYKIAEGAVGEYNGKFMVNQMVLRGGSVATPEGHTRKTYRNFFHPDLGWQFNGIRLAK